MCLVKIAELMRLVLLLLSLAKVTSKVKNHVVDTLLYCKVNVCT